MTAESKTVYVLRADDGTVLYVGVTKNVDQRVANHRTKRWGWRIASVETEELPTREEAVACEARRILELRPEHNFQHNSRDRDGNLIDWAVVAKRYDEGGRMNRNESPMQFPNWAYAMVKLNDDREADPRLAARKLAAALLKAHYGR